MSAYRAPLTDSWSGHRPLPRLPHMQGSSAGPPPRKENRMKTPDTTIRVVVFPRKGEWWLTPEGEAALDAAEKHARAIAAEARELARLRRTTEITGAPQSLL